MGNPQCHVELTQEIVFCAVFMIPTSSEALNRQAGKLCFLFIQMECSLQWRFRLVYFSHIFRCSNVLIKAFLAIYGVKPTCCHSASDTWESFESNEHVCRQLLPYAKIPFQKYLRKPCTIWYYKEEGWRWEIFYLLEINRLWFHRATWQPLSID